MAQGSGVWVGGRGRAQAPGIALLAGLIVWSASPVAFAGDFCTQLKGKGTIGKYITVTAADGAKTIEGTLAAVESDLLILELDRYSTELQPLYDRGKIVEPSRLRAFVNCSQIFSVVEQPQR